MSRGRDERASLQCVALPEDPIYALRAQVAREIVRALGGSFAQYFISRRYGIPQPRMSELCRGKVERCSLEWLIRRVHRMGGTVSLTIAVEDEAARSRRAAIERRALRQRAVWEARRAAVAMERAAKGTKRRRGEPRCDSRAPEARLPRPIPDLE